MSAGAAARGSAGIPHSVQRWKRRAFNHSRYVLAVWAGVRTGCQTLAAGADESAAAAWRKWETFGHRGQSYLPVLDAYWVPLFSMPDSATGGSAMSNWPRGIFNPRESSRRDFLQAAAIAGLALSADRRALAQPVPGQPATANGGDEPYPIPWLDKNGSHNQPAGPNLEPSHIYHFKGRVAR